jgi:Uma2 family endonuclease
MATATLAPKVCTTLESGDRLTPEEFDRRYELRPDIKKAELIRGVVYVASPVRIPQHALPDSFLGGEFAAFARGNRKAASASNGTIVCPDGSRVQPDHLLRKLANGTSRLNDAGYLEGAPELVAEVAASSASYDLHDKKDLYAEIGVAEYIVWLTEDETITWYVLRDGAYAPLAAGADGMTRSVVFPGLAIDLERLLSDWREMSAG